MKLFANSKRFISIASIASICALPIASVKANPSSVPQVPGIRVLLPDISKMSFGSLPNFTSGGSINFGSYAQQYLPGDSAIHWKTGDAPKNILKLGFFEDSFNLQSLSLDNISPGASNYALKQFGLIKKQTLDSLVKAIPDLLNIPASNIPPIADLLTSAGITNIDAPLSSILSNYDGAGSLKLGDIDLSKYKVSEIPGLSSVSLGSLKDWETSTISSIPGLSELPFTQFPNPLTLTGTGIGMIDVAFSYKESRRVRTISGSDRAGFKVPCTANCAGFEVNGNQAINGSFWISGKKPAPWVSGGYGVLGSVGGGEEPHGRHPFGKAFKVVITDTSEKKGTVDFSAYMRFCKRGWIDLGCTPYIIGPIPLFPGIKEKTWIPLGASKSPTHSEYSLSSVALTESSTPSNSLDLNLREFTDNQSLSYLKKNKLNCITRRGGFSVDKGGQPYLGDPKIRTTFFVDGCPPLSRSGAAGISISLLADALVSVEGDYATTGIFTCDAAANCGRNLGAGKFNSSQESTRQAIASKLGGDEFLKRLDKGEKVSGVEVVHFLSPYDQKKLISDRLPQLIEVATNQVAEKSEVPLHQPLTNADSRQRKSAKWAASVSVPSNFARKSSKFLDLQNTAVRICLRRTLPYTTSSIIERVGQIYFSGSGSTLNSTVQNFKGVSALSYGKDVASYYASNEYSVDNCNHE
jgi:hypothetical protein